MQDLEEPNRGEPGRWGFSDRFDADSHYFIYYNLNKRSITCNLKIDEVKALLAPLIEEADVLVENMAANIRPSSSPFQMLAKACGKSWTRLCRS